MKNIACLGLAAVALLMSSCIDKDLYRPAKKVADISEYFDFNTSTTVKVSIKYGSIAAGALLEFYIYNPLQQNEDGTFELIGDPIYRVFTDNKGEFSGKIELPTSVDKLYIYSPIWRTPMLVEAKVEQGRITVDKNIAFGSKTKATRADGDEAPYQIYPVDGHSGFYALYSGYDDYGNVDNYMDGRLLTEGDLNATFYTKLQYILWGEKLTKPSGLDNSKYLKDASVVNTTLQAEAEDPATGEVKTIESASLYFTLVGESGWFESAIGYYYYKTADGVPDNPSQVKKFFILPNTSIPYQAPYGVATRNNFVIDSSLAPASINTRVKLLFVDEDGVAHDSFPPGYTIGYFLLPAAFGEGTSHSTTMKFNKSIIYSNDTWNTDKRKRFIALRTTDGSIVYGCEDGQDKSCEDVLFTISASPNYAIKKDEIPPIDIEAVEQELYLTEYMERTYAFEDIWPDRGDYDLNDVIVEHKRTVVFNQKNYVAKIMDEFTPVQPAGSATYVDAFAVQYKENLRGRLTLPQGAIDETATNSVIVLTDARNGKGVTYTVTREFDHSLTNGLAKTTFNNEDYNPFIISQYVPNDHNRVEIHMPKAKATSYADSQKIGAGDEAFYMDADGKHPFAITLPILNWSPVPERKSISLHYLGFDDWVQSNGTKNTDWYLHP